MTHTSSHLDVASTGVDECTCWSMDVRPVPSRSVPTYYSVADVIGAQDNFPMGEQERPDSSVPPRRMSREAKGGPFLQPSKDAPTVGLREVDASRWQSNQDHLGLCNCVRKVESGCSLILDSCSRENALGPAGIKWCGWMVIDLDASKRTHSVSFPSCAHDRRSICPCVVFAYCSIRVRTAVFAFSRYRRIVQSAFLFFVSFSSYQMQMNRANEMNLAGLLCSGTDQAPSFSAILRRAFSCARELCSCLNTELRRQRFSHRRSRLWQGGE